MSNPVDQRQVVLLKSRKTNNRFYTLVEPDSGLKNADTVDDFPPELVLGIAYPCLEDGLNDFAVIRTTFETIDVFPDDEELRVELMGIITDARRKLVDRLEELRDCVARGQAHFLGTDYGEFKDRIVHLATKGAIRRTLDNMMKVDVFESVAKVEHGSGGGMADPMYRHEFLEANSLATMQAMEPRAFIARLFQDVLDAVNNDENYQNRYTFDRHVFQKFIAVMFVNYSTTDPEYYGTNRDDYGVSSDKDMQETPLYQAVGAGLRAFERGQMGKVRGPLEDGGEEDLTFLFSDESGGLSPKLAEAGHTVQLPFGAPERMLMEPLVVLSDAIRLLKHVDHPRSPEVQRLATTAARQLFKNLQELQILSPLAKDPIEDVDS
jgi:hypothetical protein